MMESDFWADWQSILAVWQTYFGQESSLQDSLLNAFIFRKSRPLIFSDFYQRLCHFELALEKITLLFNIVPLAEESFVLEVSLYYRDLLPENLLLISQIFWQLLCDFTLAEDLVYMEQIKDQARRYFFSPNPPFHPSRDVIFLYRQLYSSVLSNLLKEAITLNSKN